MQITNSPGGWQEEWHDMLVVLIADERKLSAPQIAEIISTAFGIKPQLTRASVVGRCRRTKLKLPREHKKAKPQPDEPLFVNPRPKLVYEPDRRESRRGQLLPEPAGVPGIYLLNASDRDCRYPLGEPTYDMRVCGEPVAGATRYCSACGPKVFSAQPWEGGGVFVLPTKSRGNR